MRKKMNRMTRENNRRMHAHGNVVFVIMTEQKKRNRYVCICINVRFGFKSFLPSLTLSSSLFLFIRHLPFPFYTGEQWKRTHYYFHWISWLLSDTLDEKYSLASMSIVNNKRNIKLLLGREFLIPTKLKGIQTHVQNDSNECCKHTHTLLKRMNLINSWNY